MGNKRFFELSAVGVTLLLAAILRLHGLGQQSFWNDETATRLTAIDPNLHFFQVEAPGENTPAPYFFIIKAWMKVFGSSDTSVRMPSALCGIASVLMIYLLGRRLTHDPAIGFLVGLFAALLLAMSRFHIAYSQEARSYSMAFLLGVVACYALAILLTSQCQWPQWLYVFSTMSMFWTHPTTLFLFVAQGVFIGFCYVARILQPAGISLRRWLTLFGAIVISIAPWSHMADYLSHGGQAWMPKPNLHEIAESFVGGTTACFLLGALAIASGIYVWKRKDAHPLLGWLLALLPVAAPVLLSAGRHSYFVPRYGIVCLIGISITAAFGAALLGRVLGGVAILLVCLVLSPPLIADYRSGLNAQVKPDLRGAAEQIKRMAPSGTAVWCPWDLLNYPLTDYLSGSGLTILESLPPRGSAEAARMPRVWMVLERGTGSRSDDLATAIQLIGTAPYEIKAMWLRTGVAVIQLGARNPPATQP